MPLKRLAGAKRDQAGFVQLLAQRQQRQPEQAPSGDTPTSGRREASQRARDED